MKVGFASLVGLPPIPLQESVAWAAANGLQGMEVNIGPGYPVTDGKSLHGHLDLDHILSDGPESPAPSSITTASSSPRSRP